MAKYIWLLSVLTFAGTHSSPKNSACMNLMENCKQERWRFWPFFVCSVMAN